MPPPIPLVIIVLAALGLFGLEVVIIKSTRRGTTSGIQSRVVNPSKVIQSCVVNPSKESQLKTDAQKALDAIGSKRKLSASYKRANRGQHVFNNGLLKFHRSVLQDLLRDVGGYDEQLENLMGHLVIPLSQSQQHSISTMVAVFRSDEFYVDFNADVFGEYVNELRQAIVEYLKADSSVNENGRRGIQATRLRVNFIARKMEIHEVYVDPMARDRWWEQNQDRLAEYVGVKDALKEMFQNILDPFQNVSDMIREFRRRNNWSPWK